jgi:hypothetical protein
LHPSHAATGQFPAVARELLAFGQGNKAGLLFNNGASDSELSWGVGVNLIGAGGETTIQSIISPNIDRTWEYEWDPMGGIWGVGRLTATLSGPGGGTKFVDLNPLQRSVGVQFDSFGFAGHFPSPPSPRSSFFADMYIDDVSYSTGILVAQVPESASAVIWSTLTVLVTMVARFQKRHGGAGFDKGFVP